MLTANFAVVEFSSDLIRPVLPESLKRERSGHIRILQNSFFLVKEISINLTASTLMSNVVFFFGYSCMIFFALAHPAAPALAIILFLADSHLLESKAVLILREMTRRRN